MVVLKPILVISLRPKSRLINIADIEFPVVVVVGVQSPFHVESNLGYVRLS